MLKKKIAALAAGAIILGSVLAGCGNNESGSGDNSKSESFKAAMVTDTGGVDDKSFNQSAWEGLQKFGKDNGLKENSGIKYLQSTKQADYAPNLNQLVQQNYNIIFGIGYLMQEDIQKVAKQHPDAHFGLVDSVAVDENQKPLKNVASLTFKEHQGSFLVGVVAGLTTKTNKVGFVGGVNGALIKKFENGFKAGVKSVNPDAEIAVQYAEAFDAPDKGQSIASTMYEQGADIIYHSAGGTGNGVFTEAKNRAKNGEKVWVIGVDRDQHDEGMPENVTLTSMVKRVDLAIEDAATKAKDGDFPGGQVIEYGLAEDGVGLAPTTDNLEQSVIDEANSYKEKIINGDIVVPTTDSEYKTFLSTLEK